MKDQLLLSYHQKGSGEDIVLLPGMLATTNFWKVIQKKLSTKYKVTSLDLLGFGLSPKPDNIDYSYQDHLESLNNTLTHLNIQKFTLVGHSMGGLIALNYAKAYPNKVKKLFIISPPLFTTPKEASQNINAYSGLPKILLEGIIAQIACKIFCQTLRPLTALILMPFLFKNLDKQIAYDSLLHTYNSYYKNRINIIENKNNFTNFQKTKIPLTIIYGENDSRIIKKNLTLLSKNSHIKIKSHPNLTHQLPLENPEIILNLIDS